MENCKLMSYNMATIEEDEFECRLQKLGDHRRQQHTSSYNKVDVKSSKIVNNYKMVRLDEDELECLRKLGEHSSTTTTTSQKVRIHRQSKTSTNNYKMMGRIDEDELECLRRIEENTTTTTTNNNNYNYAWSTIKRNNNIIGEVSTKMKLESKKSEDINESAEKFIQSFKKQLVLQRLESIENADQMLARGL